MAAHYGSLSFREFKLDTKDWVFYLRQKKPMPKGERYLSAKKIVKLLAKMKDPTLEFFQRFGQTEADEENVLQEVPLVVLPRFWKADELAGRNKEYLTKKKDEREYVTDGLKKYLPEMYPFLDGATAPRE